MDMKKDLIQEAQSLGIPVRVSWTKGRIQSAIRLRKAEINFIRGD
jgi:hypothetical protein